MDEDKRNPCAYTCAYRNKHGKAVKGRLFPLYSFINKYHRISFDFYDKSGFGDQNLIVVKDRAAVQCSIDQSGRVTLAVVTNRPEKVEKYITAPCPSSR